MPTAGPPLAGSPNASTWIGARAAFQAFLRRADRSLAFVFAFLLFCVQALPASAQIDTATLERADPDKIAIAASRPVVDRATRNQIITISLTNVSGAPIEGPIRLVVDSFSAGTLATTPDDQTADGKPVFIAPNDPPLADGGVLRIPLAFSGVGRARLIVNTSAFIDPAPVVVAPEIEIVSPADGAIFGIGASPITVSGTITEPADVSVNGVAASLDGLSFLVEIPLIEGDNLITATATNAGGSNSDSITVTFDNTAPEITIDAPADGAVVDVSPITVSGSAPDATTVFTINGLPPDIAGPGTFSISLDLAPGANTIDVVGTDAAGNVGSASVTVTFQAPDVAPPTISFLSPADGAILNTATAQFTVSAQDDVALDRVEINGATASPDGANFSATLTLAEGPNTVTATAFDQSGNSALASITVTVDTGAEDVTPPSIAINSPADGATLTVTNVAVTGTADDDVALAGVTVNGVAALVNGNTFSANVSLAEGANTITATATDAAGNSASDSVAVTVDTSAAGDLTIAINAPADGAEFNTPNILVNGTVSDPDAALAINGAPFSAAGDGSFSVGFTLVEGANLITVTADRDGTPQASDSISVNFAPPADITPPAVAILDPANGATFSFSPVPVSGTIDDNSADVFVNGAPAIVAGGTFSATVPLTEGPNVLTVSATDEAGNVGSASVSVTLDTAGAEDVDPPEVSINSPANNAEIALLTPGTTSQTLTVEGFVFDGDATATLNGTPLTLAGGAFSQDLTINLGVNVISLVATDPAGNIGSAQIQVFLIDPNAEDTQAPIVEITEPADNFLTSDATLSLLGTVNDPTAAVTVNGAPATLGPNNSFAADINLVPGLNVIQAAATDAAGNRGTDTIRVTLDNVAPMIAITTPLDGDSFETGSITVSGDIDDPTSDVTVNGQPATIDGNTFTALDVALAPGGNSITARAEDAAGNIALDTINVSLSGGGVVGDGQAPLVRILTPAAAAQTTFGAVDVMGTAEDMTEAGGEPVQGVMVNGVPATLNGNLFEALNVPLDEGKNLITAVATDAAGTTGTDSVLVTRDTTSPSVMINAPSDGAKLTSSQVTVVGVVNDLIGGLTTEEKISVEVNGRSATVINGTFEVRDLLLVRGINTIRAVARDPVGNESETSIQVEVLDDTGQQRIVLISGNNQTSVVGAEVPRPLVVELQDADGRVIPNTPVTFKVVKSDGVVSAAPGERFQEITVRTDDFGRASTFFQLGTRTGAGNNQVSVMSQGFVGEVIFCQTALPGEPVNLIPVLGGGQRGIGGQPLPQPLQVLATDAFGNAVDSAQIDFVVAEGGGSIGGNTGVSVFTDLDGRASVIFTPGESSGVNNNLVIANIAGLSEPIVNFFASSVAPDLASAENTSFSGVVLDMGGVPIPGARISILEQTGRSVLTDEDGRFTISGVPVGVIHLLVEGDTSPREEEEGLVFTFLSFQVTTIPGQDNTIGMPIQIPALDQSTAKIVGGDEDVVLTMTGVPGVEYTIFANSAFLPNGERYVGPLSLTQVAADRVPMPPPNGTAPSLFSTLQPANIHFDPAIRVCMPNVDGLAPGQVIDIVSFDHDLEEFVSVGPGTVSEDGSQVCSDPGFGIVKSGWHGAAPPPPPPICKVFCNDQNECTSDSRKPAPACGCDNQPTNEGGACGGNPGRNSCVQNGTCTDGFCLGMDEPDGTSCDDGLACTEMSECKSGICFPGKKKEVDQPIPSKISFDFSTLNKALEAIAKVAELLGRPIVPPKPEFEFTLERMNECCEQKGGATTLERKIEGKFTLRNWNTGDLPLGTPPWVWFFNRTVLGQPIVIEAGTFVNLGLALSISLAHTKNECVDQSCASGNVNLGGSVTLKLKAQLDNPFTDPVSCERMELGQTVFVNCALLLVEGSGTTGLSGQGFVDCVKVGIKLQHDGFKLGLKLIFFEGTIAQFSAGRDWEILPPLPIYEDSIPLGL